VPKANLTVHFQERLAHPAVLQHLIRVHQFSPWLASLLARRVTSSENADAILNATLAQLPNPLLLPDMEKASMLVMNAILSQHHILCVVDYDSDGISSGAVLQEGLRALGAHVRVQVTNRHEDGYGFSVGACRRIMQLNPLPDLIITADLGSSDGAQIAELQAFANTRNKQIRIIVTDHHHISSSTPPKTADAFVNPHRKDIDHQYPHPICGAMVAWNLLAATRAQLRKYDATSLEAKVDIRNYLDFVAIATISDMVPLDHPINRIVVRYGLMKMNQKQRPAWQLLASLLAQQDIREDTIGFQIAPRINALSRMGDDGQTALEWLTTHQMTHAQSQWAIMNQFNDDRKDEQAYCEQEALQQMRTQLNDNQPIIICYIPQASHGVVGLAANKVVQHCGRPAIIFANTEQGQLTGSARSIAGYDIRDLLERAQNLVGHCISKFGGHAMAAGITLHQPSDLGIVRDCLINIVSQDFNGKAPEAVIFHDGDLPKELLSIEGLAQLQQLAPFGQLFPSPAFLIAAQASKITSMGKNGQHLRITLLLNDKQQEAVWFNALWIPKTNQEYEWIVQVSENAWQGKKSVQLMVLGVKV
jgi:single-stranded-DNA-specific exonuclease